MAELKKILHVDDDDDIRVITRMSLEVVGQFTVHQCASGSEALEAAEAFQPDLFLLDVMMPGMTGEEVWSRLHGNPKLSHVPAIFMTAKAQEKEASFLLSTGAIGVITKPFDPMNLGQEIEAAWNAYHASA